MYDEKGRFSAPRFRRLFARYDADGDGALDGEELARLCAENRADLVGHVGSRAEFGLLLDLAGEDRNGKKVLTRGPPRAVLQRLALLSASPGSRGPARERVGDAARGGQQRHPGDLLTPCGGEDLPMAHLGSGPSGSPVRRSGLPAVAVALLCGTAAATAQAPAPPGPAMAAQAIETSLFLIGDAGHADRPDHPVVSAVRGSGLLEPGALAHPVSRRQRLSAGPARGGRARTRGGGAPPEHADRRL